MGIETNGLRDEGFVMKFMIQLMPNVENDDSNNYYDELKIGFCYVEFRGEDHYCYHEDCFFDELLALDIAPDDYFIHDGCLEPVRKVSLLHTGWKYAKAP